MYKDQPNKKNVIMENEFSSNTRQDLKNNGLS